MRGVGLMRKPKFWFMTGEVLTIVGIGIFRSAVLTLAGFVGALLGAIGALVTLTGAVLCSEAETLHKTTSLELEVKVLEYPLENPVENSQR